MLQKIRFGLLAILITLLPFHAFFITWSGAMWLASWKEIVMLVLGILILVEITIQKIPVRLDLLDYFILGYLLLALLWLIPQRNELLRWLFGFRIDVAPFLLFALLRKVPWQGHIKKRLLQIALTIAAVVSVFGILHALVLPPTWLTQFGYSINQAKFTGEMAISGCQYIQETSRFCRAIATFGGPTRFGAYLMVIAGVLLIYTRSLATLIPGLGLVLTNIILTLSRSIWIATIGIILIGLTRILPKRGKIIAAGLLFICLIGVVGLYLSNKDSNGLLNKIIVRTTSTDEHIFLIKEGARLAQQNPLGIGLGRVGPVSTRFSTADEKPFLTENWFLQIGLELGVIGLILFIGIIVLLIKNSRGTTTAPLIFSLIGLVITGFFTHSFEELAATVTLLTLWAVYWQKPVVPAQSKQLHS